MALNLVPCWGNTLRWRMDAHCIVQELRECTRCSWETKVRIHRKKNPPANSPLPLPNPAHLVFNIHKGRLFPFPTAWNLEFSSKAEQDMNLAHPPLAGPSASSFARAWFQVQSLSTVTQWINLIKRGGQESNSRCRNLSAHMPQSHCRPTLMAVTWKTILKSYCFRPTTIFEPRQMSRDERGKRSCWVPFLPWQTQVDYFLWPAPPSEILRKKRKKVQLMRIAALFTPQ